MSNEFVNLLVHWADIVVESISLSLTFDAFAKVGVFYTECSRMSLLTNHLVLRLVFRYILPSFEYPFLLEQFMNIIHLAFNFDSLLALESAEFKGGEDFLLHSEKVDFADDFGLFECLLL